MQPNTRLTALLAAVLLWPLACNHDGARFGAEYPDRDINEARADMNGNFVHMADNALLHDMALADFHFVAHTTELSGTGEARLKRFVPLLMTYGGTVRYETDLVDAAVLDQRLAHAAEYLEHAGCDMERVQLRAMISGGRGMTAQEALIIREQASSANAQQSSGLGGLMSGGAGGL